MKDVLARTGTYAQESSMVPFVIISQWFLRSGLVAASLTKSNKSAVEWSKTNSFMGCLPIVTSGHIPEYGRSMRCQPSHDWVSRWNLLPYPPLETQFQSSQSALHQFNCVLNRTIRLAVVGWTKLVYESEDETVSDDEEEVDDEEVDVDDRKSLVDMLLDCWKRNGVKVGDLPEIMRVAKL